MNREAHTTDPIIQAMIDRQEALQLYIDAQQRTNTARGPLFRGAARVAEWYRSSHYELADANLQYLIDAARFDNPITGVLP